ncbi:MAG: hypothetical protein GXX82_08175 [Syntrophorhabdus sp.]|jgi:hypothetical protein|nr:hypothetical protein [Syntrophorhabdus sp.]
MRIEAGSGPMTATNDLIGYITPQNSRELTCAGVTCVDGISFEGHVFLLSLMPCCGLLALPFWAKVSGRLVNEREEEAVLAVVVTLFDADGQRLADYSDVIAVEAGEKGTCDVKLLGFQETAETYTIAVTDMELA